MANSDNHLVTVSGIKKFAEKVNDMLPSDSLNIPNDANGVYVIKGGQWTKSVLIEKPSEWMPNIYQEEIVLTVDEDMNPYQLTGGNVTVNI